MDNKIHISYDELQRDTIQLALIIQDTLDLSNVELVCVSRGGLLVGGILSYALGLKNAHCVSLESYYADENNAKNPVACLTPFLPAVDKTKTYLFIDDLVDSGDTMQFIQTHCQENGIQYKTAAIYKKEHASPDLCFKTYKSDAWLVFPWDTMEEEMDSIRVITDGPQALKGI